MKTAHLSRFFVAGILAGGALMGSLAMADDFPSRPVTLIVPWPPGGASDGTLRALARATEPHLGQPIVIENRPGVVGTLGPALMARTAAPDGYTISQTTQSMFRLPHIQQVNYDPIADFSYIIRLTGFTFGLVVNAKSPWQNIHEFLTYAQANPGRVNYGTPGAASTPHLAVEALALPHDIRWQNVPYKGGSENLAALLGGHIDAMTDSTIWAPHVAQGNLRLLATYGTDRAEKWPDAPTLHEIVPGLIFDSPYGLGAPAGTPPARIRVLHDAFKKGLEDAQFQRVMRDYDQTPRYMNSDDYTRYNQQIFAEEKILMERLGLAKAD